MLAARDLARAARGQLAQADEIERVRGPALDLRAGKLPFLEPEGDVLPYRHVRPQRVVLEHHSDIAFPRRNPRDVPAVHQHPAGLREGEAGDDAEQRGFARTGGAEQSEELPGLDHEIDIAQHLRLAEGKRNVVELDPDFGHVSLRVPNLMKRACGASQNRR